MNSDLLIWLLPGMGADHRLFHKIKLKTHTRRDFDWPTHLRPRSLREIAEHFTTSQTEIPDVLIGCSMGGMVALEIAQIIPVKLVIQISSSTGIQDWRPWLKWVRQTGSWQMATPRLIDQFSQFAPSVLSIRTPDDKKLILDMVRSTGGDFLQASIRSVMSWQGVTQPNNLIQIIGSRDRLFDHRRMSNPLLLVGAGHTAVLDQADEISALIHRSLEQRFNHLAV